MLDASDCVPLDIFIDPLPEAQLPVLRPSASERCVNDDLVPTRGRRRDRGKHNLPLIGHSVVVT